MTEIIWNHWGRGDILGRLVHWNLLDRMLIGRVHAVIHWGLIDMNRLPMVRRYWRVGSGGDQRWSWGDDEWSECSRCREGRSWVWGGGGQVVWHGGGDVMEVVVVHGGRQRLHLLVRWIV